MEEKQKDNKQNKKNIILNVVLWIFSVFFILTGLVYFNKIAIPSILILIAGILMLPPLNNFIKEKLNQKPNGKYYLLIKNVFIGLLIIAFMCYVPTENTSKTNAFTQNVINENNEILTQKTEMLDGVYEGEVQNNKKNGKGKFTWKDGATYNGEWKNDNINGEGTLTINADETYTGNFVNGKKSGKGVYTFANGDKYEGSFVGDRMSRTRNVHICKWRQI